MLGVIYEMKEHKKINGTLFYCFEYFIFLNQYKDTTLYLTNIDEEYLLHLKELFTQRYNFDTELLNKITLLNGIREMYDVKLEKALYLDVKTFMTIGMFFKCDTIIYSNEWIDKPTSKVKDIKLFGYYDYQNFDVKEKLKFHFGIYAPIPKTDTKTAFVSGLNADENVVINNLNITEKNYIFKPIDRAIDDLFMKFDVLYYYHSAFDKNNRLIPECFFYNKEVKITYTDLPKDSIYYRYNDIKENGIGAYTLDENDLLIKEMLWQK